MEELNKAYVKSQLKARIESQNRLLRKDEQLVNPISIKETSLEDALIVHQGIPEFSETDLKSKFNNRCESVESLILTAYLNETPMGYLISYDRFNDKSLYCWMTWVKPGFRRRGFLKELMSYQASWAKRNGYDKLRIKTRNNQQAMLNFLVKYGFKFTKVKSYPNIEDNRIELEKEL